MASSASAEPEPTRSPGRGLRGVLNDERVRFILIGGLNTSIGYLIFVILELSFGSRLGYFFSLYGSFLLSSVSAFLLHRRVTFRVSGSERILLDFLRFLSVYTFALVINSIALPLLVEVGAVPPLLAQALIVAATTLVSYFGHKFFSFRRRPDLVADDA
ncbi:GtrA family protein [Cryobacterium gelidum]|uniref:GtrA family protein n=1 Tax=Cryobacterium gelidum TaxID=1259164 RepID=A0A4R9AWP8_9MICO|nr:GtrA family protein [Cryobacterium gelidum]TFD71232.1 GtrA family protein [Cryobacterium gelidum]